jgi:hypothetical protein
MKAIRKVLLAPGLQFKKLKTHFLVSNYYENKY